MTLTRSAPKPKKRKTSWRSVKRDPLDILWSKVVRARDGHTCQGMVGWRMPSLPRTAMEAPCFRDSSYFQIEAAHIISRRYKKTRYDPRNGVALCKVCHDWTHAHKTEFEAWAKDRLGDDYNTLLYYSKHGEKPDEEAWKVALRARLRELEGRE